MVATMASTSAVSRLHKLIPVYSFYSYWRIKMPLLLFPSESSIFKITEDKTLMPDFYFKFKRKPKAKKVTVVVDEQ